MEKDLIIVGGGGHCRSCIDVIESTSRFRIRGILDKYEKLGLNVFGYEIIATDSNLYDIIKKVQNFHITLGQIKDHRKRKMLFDSIKSHGAEFPTIISPNSYISRHAVVGEGTIVMHHAVINAGAKIGRNCIINTKALIEHDAMIQDHCHISTNAIINGGCNIESGVFIGSSTTLREYVNIGENSIIGFKEKIFKDVPPKTLFKTSVYEVRDEVSSS